MTTSETFDGNYFYSGVYTYLLLLEMETLTEMINKFSITSYDKDTSHWVDVTYINHPHSFYVRPTLYRKYMQELQASTGSLIDPLDMHVGKIVIYKSEILKIYARGQVIRMNAEINGITCDIQALDHGCLDKAVPLKQMYKPVIDSYNLPPLAIHCQLSECYPIGRKWDDKSIDAMKCYVGTEQAKVIIKDKKLDILIVELINSCPDDIATLLVKTDYASLGFDFVNNRLSSSSENKNMHYIYKKFKVGDKLWVRVQSGKALDSFFVCAVEDYKPYLQEKKNFTLSYKALNEKIRPEDIEAGLPVAVLTEDQRYYERAVIKQFTSSQDKYVVQYVDSGNIVTAHFNCMKPLLPYHYTRPALAIYCSIDKESVQDTGLQKLLHPGYDFIIEIKKVGDKHNSPNIVQIMPILST
ncbi:uncharacterized protein LOC113519397 [Galleria mellonella]|uniref:Uncharacterized protein LOC113519397 n=1 Tax=Galleria mellonella TaxID=7137 RepID=A0A6J1WW68_GALME|nr:uncharacterized protein LOC113519397 [Galleria mellonella]